jgi:negative modulator of initiation of replication
VKTLLIDDDLYSYLVSHTRDIGESASSILRRLLGSKSGGYGAQTPREELVKTFDFLQHWEQFRHLTHAKKFLHILSWAYRKHPHDFPKVVSIEGNRRKYFASNEKTLLDSGSSTNPRPIPDSPFWVITNNSTAKKAEILSDVFRLLGYEDEQIHALVREFSS